MITSTASLGPEIKAEAFTLESIIECLRSEPDIPPDELSKMLVWLSGEYGYIAAKFEETQNDKAAAWIMLREDSKSASEADKRWEMTEQGRLERNYRRQLKVIEKLMSSLKARLRVKEIEGKNIY